jgi:hypothetical protein
MGYAQVATRDQSPTLQSDALTAADGDGIGRESGPPSSRKRHSPTFAKATPWLSGNWTVWPDQSASSSRLPPPLRHAASAFVFSTQQIDTTTPVR